MDLYTLDSGFNRKDIVEDFTSAIWTERYKIAGDTNVVVPDTAVNRARFQEGTFLARKGTKEVMLLDTLEIEKGFITVSGSSVLKFLNQRVIRTSPAHDLKTSISDFGPGGRVMRDAIYDQVIDNVGPANGLIIDDELISVLSLGDIDDTGDSLLCTVPYGPMYDALVPLAETFGLGMSIYLDSPGSLKFTVYRGVDRTSDQTTNPVVRFSSLLDSLDNAKELYSIVDYKNVCYAFIPGLSDQLIDDPAIAYADLTPPTDFARRTMMIWCDDIATLMPAYEPDPALDELENSDAKGVAAEVWYLGTGKALAQKEAVSALANNNFTRVVDGEVVQQSQYKFGEQYSLGDFIELQASDGLRQTAQVTEYIWSEDENGEKNYPTVTVIGD